MDVFHTGNYIRSHYNFRISGLSGSKEYNPLVSTLRNIYFRGTPTAPSLFLRSRLNDIGIKYTDKPSIHIDTNHQPNWSLSILGSEGGYNPALSFYNTQLKQALGEYDFLYPLFRPETDISDIIQTEEGLAFQKERVDFFLPTANLVIEIDGSQHQSGTQSQRDKFRNKLLSKHSIKTFNQNS